MVVSNVLKGGTRRHNEAESTKTRKRFAIRRQNPIFLSHLERESGGRMGKGRKRLNRIDDDVVCKSFCSIFGVCGAVLCDKSFHHGIVYVGWQHIISTLVRRVIRFG
jgi:hypothetical protein